MRTNLAYITKLKAPVKQNKKAPGKLTEVPLSKNKQVRREVMKIMAHRNEITLYNLRKEIIDNLGFSIRLDWLTCNLYGLKNLYIDCEHNTVLKLKS